MAGFMTKCNAKGEYFISEDIPSHINYHYSDAHVERVKKLNNCREFRNEKNWKTYCGDICDNYSIT